jgi:hypothetical protein
MDQFARSCCNVTINIKNDPYCHFQLVLKIEREIGHRYRRWVMWFSENGSYEEQRKDRAMRERYRSQREVLSIVAFWRVRTMEGSDGLGKRVIKKCRKVVAGRGAFKQHNIESAIVSSDMLPRSTSPFLLRDSVCCVRFNNCPLTSLRCGEVSVRAR